MSVHDTKQMPLNRHMSQHDIDALEEEEEQAEQGNFFTFDKKVTWTASDAMRLLNIDELHTRLLEYHNNVHARNIDVDESFLKMKREELEVISPLSPQNERPCSAMVMHFIEPSSGEYKDRNAPFPIYGSSIPESVKEMLLRQREHERELYETAMAANNGDGTNSNASKNDGSSSRTKSKGVQYTRQQMAENLLWIHVKEPSLLHDLAKEVGMHELCMAGFLDIRAFSSFIPVPHALFVSFCSFLMDGTKTNMFKTFAYITRNLVITFEREIMPDLMDDQIPEEDQICSSIMKKYDKIYGTCCKLGGIYLMNVLALQALAMQDTLIDFFSRTLFYFKQQVTTRQYHKEKLRISRQMHQVGVAVIMIKKSVSYSEETFVRLLSGAMTGAFLSPKRLTRMEAVSRPGSGGTSGSNIDTPLDVNISSQVHARIPLLSPIGLLMPDHTPYLLDLVDTYKFTNHLLLTEIEEVQALTGAMDQLTTLRSINTSTLLSFVATIFLPANFLTGVFGTNFQQTEEEGGAYFMVWLNDPLGPTYFAYICLFSSLVVIIYFAYNGWIDLRLWSGNRLWDDKTS